MLYQLQLQSQPVSDICVDHTFKTLLPSALTMRTHAANHITSLVQALRAELGQADQSAPDSPSPFVGLHDAHVLHGTYAPKVSFPSRKSPWLKRAWYQSEIKVHVVSWNLWRAGCR